MGLKQETLFHQGLVFTIRQEDVNFSSILFFVVVLFPDVTQPSARSVVFKNELCLLLIYILSRVILESFYKFVFSLNVLNPQLF